MSIFHSVINNKTKLSKLYFFGTDEDTYLKNYNIYELSKPWKLSTKISRKSETFFTKNSKEIGSFLFFKRLIFITPWKWNFFGNSSIKLHISQVEWRLPVHVDVSIFPELSCKLRRQLPSGNKQSYRLTYFRQLCSWRTL